MKDVCMRCEHGKGYFIGRNIIYIGKDGSVAIELNGEIVDFPEKTIKYCPWCGKKLQPTEKACTGKLCPMQTGYDVKNCKNKKCIFRTEKGGVQE